MRSSSGLGMVMWDVDGTLVRTAGAGTQAFLDAVEATVGVRPPNGAGAFMAGKTDPQIALELLRAVSVDDPEAHLDAVLRALEVALAKLADRIAREGRVLPGVPEVLDLLARRCGAQTLVTGNLLANARLKLTSLGLLDGIEYEVGAYGGDHRDRCQLVPIALQRLQSTGRRADLSCSWVVGDTPRDLECARAGGVRCLLVATGSASYDELADLGADAVLPDLSEVAKVVDLLTSS